jgi:DNA-binding IclR family transcriptional regulator
VVSWTLAIRKLLDLRRQHGDQKALDLLELSMAAPAGTVSTQKLMERWQVTQPNVSRRVTALQAMGLVDVSSGHGFYMVHWTVLR